MLGGSGDLTCLENATGKRIWSVNLVQKFGGVNPVLGIQRIAADRRRSHPRERRRTARVDRGDREGRRRRRCGSNTATKPGYSSPMLLRTGSLAAGRLLHRLSARSPSIRATAGCCGRTTRPPTAPRTSRRPIVRGTRVFVSSDYGTGAALLEVRAAGNIASASEVYFTRDMRNHHASSVLVGDHLYGFSSSILTALRFDTGAMAWRDRSVGKGSLIFADDRLYPLQRGRRRRPRRSQPRRLSRARPLFARATERLADLEPSDRGRRVVDRPRPGHRLCLRSPSPLGGSKGSLGFFLPASRGASAAR